MDEDAIARQQLRRTYAQRLVDVVENHQSMHPQAVSLHLTSNLQRLVREMGGVQDVTTLSAEALCTYLLALVVLHEPSIDIHSQGIYGAPAGAAH